MSWITPLMLLVSAIKVSIVIAIALAAVSLARRRSAAVRHWLLATGIAGGVAISLLQPIVPAWGGPMIPLWQLTTPAGVHVREDWPSLRLPESQADGETQTPHRDRGGVATALMTVWAMGAIVSVSMLLAGFARLMWLAARARRVVRGRWIEMTREIARESGVRRSIRVLHSAHPSLLVTWGVFRPTLLLPASAMAWSGERMRVVLCHELAHIRRNDWVMQLCADLLRCVYWCNPLLWMACTRLRHESEMACDDEVLRRGVERTAYASHVLDLARACGAHHRASAMGAAMANASGLERRIRVMLNARLDRAPLTRSVYVATVIGLAVMVPAAAGFGSSRAAAEAQTAAAIAGTIVDPSGEAVPSAQVTLMTPGGERRAATVDANGHFTYDGLPAGVYVIEVRAMGFAPVEDRVTLSPDQRIERRVSLPLGAVEESILIVGASPSATDAPLQPPTRIRMVHPAYPEELRRAGVQGTVTLDTLINADGTITHVEASPRSEPALAAAAREAVLQWRYTPTLLHGVPVETRMKVTIEFRP